MQVGTGETLLHHFLAALCRSQLCQWTSKHTVAVQNFAAQHPYGLREEKSNSFWLPSSRLILLLLVQWLKVDAGCRTVGYRLGQGESMQQIIDSMHGAVAEGVSTTKAAKMLADKLGLHTPIIQGLYRVLYGEHKRMHSSVRYLAVDLKRLVSNTTWAASRRPLCATRAMQFWCQRTHSCGRQL